MKITIRREMSISELIQSVYEQMSKLEDRYGVRFTRNTIIYTNFTNGFGHSVRCVDSRGSDVSEIIVDGPYPCAADKHDTAWMEHDHE